MAYFFHKINWKIIEDLYVPKDDVESVEAQFVKEAEKEIDGHDIDSQDGHDVESNAKDGHDIDGHDLDGHEGRKRRDVHSVEKDNDHSKVNIIFVSTKNFLSTLSLTVGFTEYTTYVNIVIGTW